MKQIADMHIRLSIEYEKMLNDLVELDKKDAPIIGRNPFTKSQIVKEAIKEYYASRINGSAANAYVDLIQNSMEPMMMSFFNTLNEKQSLLIKKLEGMAQKELLYQKLILMGTELKHNTEENHQVTIKLLNSEGGFEDAVNQKLQEYLAKDSR